MPLSRPVPLLQSRFVTARRDKRCDVSSLQRAETLNVEYWPGLVTLGHTSCEKMDCSNNINLLEYNSPPALSRKYWTQTLVVGDSACSCHKSATAAEDPHWKSIAGHIPLHVQMSASRIWLTLSGGCCIIKHTHEEKVINKYGRWIISVCVTNTWITLWINYSLAQDVPASCHVANGNKSIWAAAFPSASFTQINRALLSPHNIWS